MNLETLFTNQQQKAKSFRQERVSDRRKRVKKILQWTLNHQDRIIQAVASDLSKPETEARITEIYTVVLEARHILSNLNAWWAEEHVTTPLTLLGSKSRIVREPKGRCLIISPWNFPFNLTVIPLLSCLAAGNTAILKPSEMSPATSDLIEEMVKELFEPNEVYVAKGDHTVAEALLQLPFDHIFFTGSPHIGKIVMEAAAKNLSGVTLELGGKNPVFIAPNANLKDAARKIIWAKFMNCGQSCVSPDYVLVHKDQHDTLVEHMVSCIHQLYQYGKDRTTYGRIINERHFDRLNQLLEQAKKEGANLLTEGESNWAEKFIPPTLLTGVSPSSVLMKDEIFGPLLPVLTYTQFDEAIETALAFPKPLASYVFCGRGPYFDRVKTLVSAGALVKNDCLIHFVNPEVPFGGVNFSGMGKSHGVFGFREFVNEKPVITQLRTRGTTLFFHPPFTRFKQALVKLLVRWF